MSGNRGADRRGTVLIVDDEEETADLYAEYLDRYDIRTAYSGAQALEAYGPDVDVVLLDRRMPDVSGDEVLRRIRERNDNCYVVFTTAVEPSVELVSMDFDEYLTKPISADALRSVVGGMFDRKEYDELLQEAFDLTSKMTTLEAKMDIEELEASEEYGRLQRRFQELKETVEFPPEDDIYSDLTAEKLRILFES